MAVVTCAAVNMGSYMAKANYGVANHAKMLGRQREAEKAMEKRMEGVLTTMAVHGHDAIVLGAFGCGVFRNDPRFVAHAWARLLRSKRFHNVFRSVSFAIIPGGALRPRKKSNAERPPARVRAIDVFREVFGCEKDC